VPFGASSIQLADASYSLDMSLPSYNDIKDSKASVENVKSLSIEKSKLGLPVGESEKKAPRSTKRGAPSSWETSKPKGETGKKSGSTKMPEYDF
jgi:hypothetical protein